MNLAIDLPNDGWLETLSPAAKLSIEDMLSGGQNEEQVAEVWLSCAGPQTNVGFGATGAVQAYFANVRSEFAAFVCGDARYEKQRADAVLLWERGGQPSLVTAAAGWIATTAGLATAAIVPVIALLFSILAKIGVAAFCTSCGYDGEGKKVERPGA